MKIYDSETKEEIQYPDLTTGYLYEGTIVTGYTDARYEYLPDTEHLNPPHGLEKYIKSEPIIEKCYYYKKYTEEELIDKSSSNATMNLLYSQMVSSYKKGVNSI